MSPFTCKFFAVIVTPEISLDALILTPDKSPLTYMFLAVIVTPEISLDALILTPDISPFAIIPFVVIILELKSPVQTFIKPLSGSPTQN